MYGDTCWCRNTAVNLVVPLLVHRAHHCCPLSVWWHCSRLGHALSVCWSVVQSAVCQLLPMDAHGPVSPLQYFLTTAVLLTSTFLPLQYFLQVLSYHCSTLLPVLSYHCSTFLPLQYFLTAAVLSSYHCSTFLPLQYFLTTAVLSYHCSTFFLPLQYFLTTAVLSSYHCSTFFLPLQYFLTTAVLSYHCSTFLPLQYFLLTTAVLSYHCSTFFLPLQYFLTAAVLSYRCSTFLPLQYFLAHNQHWQSLSLNHAQRQSPWSGQVKPSEHSCIPALSSSPQAQSYWQTTRHYQTYHHRVTPDRQVSVASLSFSHSSRMARLSVTFSDTVTAGGSVASCTSKPHSSGLWSQSPTCSSFAVLYSSRATVSTWRCGLYGNTGSGSTTLAIPCMSCLSNSCCRAIHPFSIRECKWGIEIDEKLMLFKMNKMCTIIKTHS